MIKFNDKRENMIDSIKFNNEKLLRFKFEHLNEKKITNTIRIYSTNESIRLLMIRI